MSKFATVEGKFYFQEGLLEDGENRKKERIKK